MKYGEAKKLRVNDEVTDKATGEVVRVTNVVFDKPALKRPTVFIEAVDQEGHWQEYMHTEVA